MILASGGAQGGGMGSMVILMVALVGIMYFMMIRPQKKKQKEEQAMRDNVQVGDEITTIGGVIGEIVSIKDETITIETSRDRTKIRFLRSAVRSVDVRAEDKNPALKKAAPAPAAPEAKKKGKGKIAPEAPKADDKPAAEETTEEKKD